MLQCTIDFMLLASLTFYGQQSLWYGPSMTVGIIKQVNEPTEVS